MMHVELFGKNDIEHLSIRWSVELEGFQPLLHRYQDTAIAFRHIGLKLWKEGRFELAAKAFTAALSLKPENASLWSELAGAFNGLADAKRAENCISKSIELDDTRPQSWLTLADLLSRRDDLAGAAHAYSRAISLDPTSAPAHFGLGIVFFRQKKVHQAIESLRESVRLNPTDALGFTCLGHISYALADFATSIASFQAASNILPLDPDSQKTRLRALTFQGVVDGAADEALAAYIALPSTQREDIDTVLREGFALLNAFGHREAAAAVGRIRLKRNPSDAIQRYLLDAINGRPLTTAPHDYIERYFDEFAPGFNQKLVNGLNYRGPARLCDLIARHRAGFVDIVDLGCGTGLAADLLANMGGSLTGVDLSCGMLEQAGKRQRYGVLVKADVVAYLLDNPRRFDLIFAADLLVYIGDLQPFMDAAADALVPGGLLALSIETNEHADFRLLPSGRFAHRPEYIERLQEKSFVALEAIDEMIRLEINAPVPGKFLLLERRLL